jgi:hypothetical protein
MALNKIESITYAKDYQKLTQNVRCGVANKTVGSISCWSTLLQILSSAIWDSTARVEKEKDKITVKETNNYITAGNIT